MSPFGVTRTVLEGADGSKRGAAELSDLCPFHPDRDWL